MSGKECPQCGHTNVHWYTVGAPGIGAGWWCEDCGWREEVHPTRILQPWECE